MSSWEPKASSCGEKSDHIGRMSCWSSRSARHSPDMTRFARPAKIVSSRTRKLFYWIGCPSAHSTCSFRFFTEIMPVVKANAYGHGSTHLAKYLQDNGYRQFAVATALEGEELRTAGITGNIHVLGKSHSILSIAKNETRQIKWEQNSFFRLCDFWPLLITSLDQDQTRQVWFQTVCHSVGIPEKCFNH